MVGIVAVTRFCEAGSSMFASYIDYIDRTNAVRKDNLDKFNVFSEYMDYMDDDTKTISEDEAATERVSALFTRDKDELTKEEKASVKDLFMAAQTNGSNMWQTVISFDNTYLDELGIYDIQTDTLNEKLLRQASRKAIADMLKSEGLENAVWTAAFHYNTDNIHIHIATVEPTPMREKKTYTVYERDKDGKYPTDNKGRPIKRPVLDKNGKPLTYEAYRGTFKRKSIEALKSGVRSELENNTDIHKEITRLLREKILADKKEKVLLDTPEFTDKMFDLYKDLVSSGVPRKNWRYNMNVLNSYRAKIDDLSDFFIDSYHRDDFNDFVAKIEAEGRRQTRAYGGKDNNYVDNMLHGKEGLYARLGNAILSELRNYDKAANDMRFETKNAMNLLDPESGRYDLPGGLALLEDQAQRGNTYSQNELGLLYMSGKVVDRDLTRARRYFMQSAGKGDAFGKSMLEKLDHNGLGSGSRNHLYTSVPRRDIRRGLRQLENNMRHNYAKATNLREYEALQAEINARGEDAEL